MSITSSLMWFIRENIVALLVGDALACALIAGVLIAIYRFS